MAISVLPLAFLPFLFCRTPAIRRLLKGGFQSGGRLGQFFGSGLLGAAEIQIGLFHNRNRMDMSVRDLQTGDHQTDLSGLKYLHQSLADPPGHSEAVQGVLFGKIQPVIDLSLGDDQSVSLAQRRYRQKDAAFIILINKMAGKLMI